MTTFAVLAAGRGSRLGRVGDTLNKCLVPLDGRAVLSRQLDLAPPGARLVVVAGYRADQVREYLRLAHPRRHVQVVVDERWGAGPGASLLAARDAVDDDLVFTACDTLWDDDPTLWDGDESWLAVAPLPAGVPAARWCRAVTTADGVYVTEIHDKTPHVAPYSVTSTAFGRVVADDLDVFWSGLEHAEAQAGEVQLSSGLDALLSAGRPLGARSIRWTDVGDDVAYHRALRDLGVYDDVKPDQATYVLPEEARVVKFHADPVRLARRAERGKMLDDVAPRAVEPVGENFYAYEYVVGWSAYDDVANYADGEMVTTDQLLRWWRVHLWQTRLPHPPGWFETTVRFYRDKTFYRIPQLDRSLAEQALDAVTRVDFDELAEGCVPGVFHGDLTYANVLVDERTGGFVAVDWREDFAGETTWGDLRYDLGKLLGATVFHWDAAADGDFRRWSAGPAHARTIYEFARDELELDPHWLAVIGALCLVNSAPLWAPPADEILVARGCRWLERLT